MKKLFCIVFFICSLYCFSQEKPEYILKIEYIENPPINEYRQTGAYLVNTTNEAFLITKFNSKNDSSGLLGFGQVNLIRDPRRGIDSITEGTIKISDMILDDDFESTDYYNYYLDFKPGQKLLVYSGGFSQDSKTKYPYSYFIVSVNNSQVRLKAMIN